MYSNSHKSIEQNELILRRHRGGRGAMGGGGVGEGFCKHLKFELIPEGGLDVALHTLLVIPNFTSIEGKYSYFQS